MPQADFIVVLGVGGLFVLLGIGAILLGKNEEKKYFNSISSRMDAREFLEGWPRRPQFGSLQSGGWIAIVLGLIIMAIGIAFRLWG